MSSHFRVRRLATLALCAVFLLVLYLATNCWPAIVNLFGHRRYMLEELGQRARHSQTCLFSSESTGSVDGEKHPRHRPSLLARPLKHSVNSLSVRDLTLDK